MKYAKSLDNFIKLVIDFLFLRKEISFTFSALFQKSVKSNSFQSASKKEL